MQERQAERTDRKKESHGINKPNNHVMLQAYRFHTLKIEIRKTLHLQGLRISCRWLTIMVIHFSSQQSE